MYCFYVKYFNDQMVAYFILDGTTSFDQRGIIATRNSTIKLELTQSTLAFLNMHLVEFI